jgi:hypothetical protein
MHHLIPHPANPPHAVHAVSAGMAATAHWLLLRWRLSPAHSVVVPPLAGRQRRDGLWQATCFELFVSTGASSYAEFNLSPSEQWAAYDFSACREGMQERAMPRDPVCSWRAGGAFALFDAAIPLAALPPGGGPAALCAVVEEQAGAKSYWAAQHPVAAKPDFHHPAGMVLAMPPPAEG